MTNTVRTVNELMKPQSRGQTLNQASHRLKNGEHHDLLITGQEYAHAIIDLSQPDGQICRNFSNTFILNRKQWDDLLNREVPLQELRPYLHKQAAHLFDVSQGPTRGDVPKVDVPLMTPKEENGVQTKIEGQLFKNPALMQAIETTVKTSDFCKNFAIPQLTSTLIIDMTLPSLDIRPMPTLRDVFMCLATGDLVLAKSIVWMYDYPFTGKPGGRIIFDDYEVNVELFREVFVKEIHKTTKLSWGLSVSLFPTMDPSAIIPKSGTTAVKQGDPVYDHGEPKKETPPEKEKEGEKKEGQKQEPSSGKQISFNGEYLKQYYRATMSAVFRYKLSHRLVNRRVIEPKG